MKKLSILTALVAMLFLASCQPSGFSESNLYGKWENANKPGDYKVYENSAVIPIHEEDSVFKTYKWGHEWDESDGVQENDLKQYGNGWYMWKLQGNNLYEVSMTDKSWEGSLTPVTLTIKTLTPTEFQFERGGRTFLYKKK